MVGFTHISSSEDCFPSVVTVDVLVRVPWLPVQGPGLGGKCVMDGGGCL